MFEMGCIDDRDDRVKYDRQGRAYRLERVWVSCGDGSYPDIEKVYIDTTKTMELAA